MLFHHDNRPPERLPTIYLQDHLLNVARKQRHLGIVFQHDLRWAEHINTILNKSLTSLKNLLRLRNSLNSSALSYLYRTYIRPKLEYACIALSPLPINTLDRLERFQRKAARICLRLPLYTPVNHSHLLHQLNLPSLYSRRKIKHILLAHSIYHQYAPPHILQLNLPPLTTPIYSLHLFTPYVANDPTIYPAPGLIGIKTPPYTNHCIYLTYCQKTLRTHTIVLFSNPKSVLS